VWIHTPLHSVVYYGSMDLEDIIREAKSQATQAAAELDRLRARLAEVEATYERAVHDLRALEDIASRYGAGEVAPSAVPDPEPSPWAALNRQEAILRCMREVERPVRLSEIVEHLAANGRRGDTVHLVSAAIAALKRKGFVNSTARGIWQLSATSIAPLLPDSLLPEEAVVEDPG